MVKHLLTEPFVAGVRCYSTPPLPCQNDDEICIQNDEFCVKPLTLGCVSDL